MATDNIVSEPDVLIATVIFLIKRGAVPYAISVASGRGIDSEGANNRLREAFASVGHTPRFTSDGADILAVSDTEWWAIECKGSGTGASSTQRNNFDRALASVVSYFEDMSPLQSTGNQERRVYLGLALPATKIYLTQLRRRVRVPLRQRLNLWVLLYQSNSKDIRAVRPDEPI